MGNWTQHLAAAATGTSNLKEGAKKEIQGNKGNGTAEVRFTGIVTRIPASGSIIKRLMRTRAGGLAHNAADAYVKTYFATRTLFEMPIGTGAAVCLRSRALYHSAGSFVTTCKYSMPAHLHING